MASRPWRQGRRRESSLPLRALRGIVFGVLVLTLVLTYGGENFQMGGLGIPLVWVLITLASLLVFPLGLGLLRQGYPTLFMIWLVVFGGGVARLSWDAWDQGIWALRDSLFFLSSAGLPIGLVLGWHYRSHNWFRMVTVPISLAVAYSLTLPWGSLLWKASPVSGVFKAVPLFGFHNTIYVSLAGAWGRYLASSRPLSIKSTILLLAILLSMALTQTRLGYGSLPITLALVLWLYQKRARGLVAARAALVLAAIGSLLLASAFVRLPGTVGEFSPGFLLSHVRTAFGAEGPASGSVGHRMQDYPVAIQRLAGLPVSSLIIGRGLGMEMDLEATGILARRLHLDVVETVYRLGLVGAIWFILILTILWKVLRIVRALTSSRLPAEEKGSLTAVAALLLMTVVASLFQPMFYWTYGAFPYFFYGGLVLGLSLRMRTDRARAAVCAAA